MKSIALYLFLQINFLTLLTPLTTQHIVQQWFKLGDVTASFKLENESIMVTGNEKIKSIKLRVNGTPVAITSVDIYYQSGDMETVKLNKAMITSGGETKELSLKNDILKKVVFMYNAGSALEEGETLIELLGEK